MNGVHPNAVAGPSRSSSPPVSAVPAPPSSSPHPDAAIPLFLPPPGPPQPKQHLFSTQDLLSRFNLVSAYDRYVRPFVTPGNEDAGEQPQTPGGVDKGKGRELLPNTSPAQGREQSPPGGDGDDEDGTGRGDKKKKNNYKHLIKGIYGKHSMKKDDYLYTMMQVPPKQRMRIRPFDEKTQADAFTVSMEGLKGWNPNALVLESAQAREDRKKRKELKRLAKAQQALGAAISPVEHPQPIEAPVPTSISGSHRPPGTSTPRPAGAATPAAIANSRPAAVGTPRPGSSTSNVPRPGSAIPRPGSTVPRPGSTVPRPGSAAGTRKTSLPGQDTTRPSVQVPGRVPSPVKTMAPLISPTNPYSSEQRGKKRDRDEVGAVVNVTNGLGATGNGNTGTNGVVPSKNILNAKAGVAGVRPRPIKKQRMDGQGQAREVSTPVQQPTPQGV